MENKEGQGNAAEVKISIVTACYKSEAYLERVYQSIRNQDYKNIEWITVDDYSPDNTVAKLNELKSRNEIAIQILPLPKNTNAIGAIRAGIGLATGKFTFVLDHDDELLPNALSILMRAWNSLVPKDEKLYGIWGRCMDENNNMLGNPYKEAPLICTNGYFFHVLKCRVECFLMVETALLKEFYELPENQLVMTNGVIWNALGQKYRAIFTNELIRRYHTNIPGSQMKQKRILNTLSYCNQEATILNTNHDFFWKDLVFFMKKIMIYLNYSYHAGVPVKDSIKKLVHTNLRIAATLLVPLLPVMLLKNRLVNTKRYD